MKIKVRLPYGGTKTVKTQKFDNLPKIGDIINIYDTIINIDKIYLDPDQPFGEEIWNQDFYKLETNSNLWENNETENPDVLYINVKKTTDIYLVENNLTCLIGQEIDEDDVIQAFSDFEINGENYVIVSKNGSIWNAYINEANSPIFVLEFENEKLRSVELV